jgi:serine/threonine-protein kinase
MTEGATGEAKAPLVLHSSLRWFPSAAAARSGARAEQGPGDAVIIGAMEPEPPLTDLLARLRAVLADRYTIDRELGHGGMATVFLAQDQKHHRQVAIKVLKPELAAALGRERFLREIETAAGLNHPHILPLHDSGEADGVLYYVIPYVEGESLRDRLDRERQLALEDALQIAREVADALSYAHSHNVLHRDIKPGNILLSAGHALVTDFGIARAITATGVGQLTEVGTLVGTPAYMSPEQVDGSPRIDGRADIYSLGCVLFEMLVGEPPFRGSTLTAVIANRLSSPAPSPRVVRESVPEAVDAAVKKAIADLPADRFSTAAQFAEALATSRPTEPAPAAVPDRSIAVLPFTNQSSDPETEYFSDGIAEEIINALAQLPGLQVAARTSSFAFKGKGAGIAEVGAKLKVATVLDGSVRKAGNRVRITAQLVNVSDGYHLWSERYDSELDDVFAIQDHIARAIAQRFEVMLAGPTGRFAQQMATAR